MTLETGIATAGEQNQAANVLLVSIGDGNWPECVECSCAKQVLERNGGDDGARTRDLCRDRAAF